MEHLRALLLWLESVPSPAVGAILAAGVAGIVALVVAAVNSWSAQRLERAKAYRSYRAELMLPTRNFAPATAMAVRPLIGQINLENPTWAVSQPRLLAVLDQFDSLWREAGALYAADKQTSDAFSALNGVQHAFRLLVHETNEPATSTAKNAALESYGESIQQAASVVLASADAFVFGGYSLRWKARRALKRLDARVERLPGVTARSLKRLALRRPTNEEWERLAQLEETRENAERIQSLTAELERRGAPFRVLTAFGVVLAFVRGDN